MEKIKILLDSQEEQAESSHKGKVWTYWQWHMCVQVCWVTELVLKRKFHSGPCPAKALLILALMFGDKPLRARVFLLEVNSFSSTNLLVSGCGNGVKSNNVQCARDRVHPGQGASLLEGSQRVTPMANLESQITKTFRCFWCGRFDALMICTLPHSTFSSSDRVRIRGPLCCSGSKSPDSCSVSILTLTWIL